MNVFNRIIMIILLLVLAISSIVIVVNIYAILFDWSDIFGRIIYYIENTNIHLMALIFVAIIIASIALLILEFYRRKLKTANVASVSDGKAMVTTKGASRQIEEDIADLKDVDNLRVRVVPKSNGAIINISARLYKGINVSEKMQEVISRANKSARENLGVKIIKTNFIVSGFLPRVGAGIHPDEKEDTVSQPEESSDTQTTEEEKD
ncbi:hypothetical protein ACFLQS_01915 [Actinomycetota bacterium]